MRGNFFYKKIGECILYQRKRKFISQEQLALQSAIDRGYLSRIETGQANPSVKILNKIARVLKMKLSQLIKGV